MNPLLAIGLVALGICALTAAFVVYMYKYQMNPSGKTDIDTKRINCTRCTSGVQCLHNGHWGPIPESMRIVQDGVYTFEAPLANTRSCNRCMGRGWYPRDRRVTHINR